MMKYTKMARKHGIEAVCVALTITRTELVVLIKYELKEHELSLLENYLCKDLDKTQLADARTTEDYVIPTWSKPKYKIVKHRAWRTKKFDEYQLKVMFKGQEIMVDYEVAKTDGLLSAIEKAGKEAIGEMKELLRELWLVVRPYKVAAMARQEAEVEPLADARSAKEPFTYKDTAKGIMYAVKFRGQTVYIVKAVVLKHGWKKAIEHAAKSGSEKYKELLRGLWKAC
jgi:hypothetical protein